MGIIFAVKRFLRFMLFPTAYGATILSALIGIFKGAWLPAAVLVFLIPQPNIISRFFDYPFGPQAIDILILGTLVGRKDQPGERWEKSNVIVIVMCIIAGYLSLWNLSFNFGVDWPLSFKNGYLSDWKNYVRMMLLYFAFWNIAGDREDRKKFVLLMVLVVLFIAIRNYRNFSGGQSFSYEKRVGGPFEAVGLGANHYGAFIAYCWAFCIGIGHFVKGRTRYWYYAATAFCLHPLFYSYSRGAYLGALTALVVFGFVQKRSVLVVVMCLFMFWKVVLPSSVVDRIEMTKTAEGEIEGSAAHRIDLWNLAIDTFERNPVFGIGYGGFGLTVPEGELTDTHNYYIRVLCEEGMVGFVLHILLIFGACKSGIYLYANGVDEFDRGLGLGFLLAVIVVVITNLFGDRWSYITVGGYFWIIWGIVDRAIDGLRTSGDRERVVNTM